MQSTTNYMVKNLTQKKIASYTSRLLESYNSLWLSTIIFYRLDFQLMEL